MNKPKQSQAGLGDRNTHEIVLSPAAAKFDISDIEASRAIEQFRDEEEDTRCSDYNRKQLKSNNYAYGSLEKGLHDSWELIQGDKSTASTVETGSSSASTDRQGILPVGDSASSASHILYINDGECASLVNGQASTEFDRHWRRASSSKAFSMCVLLIAVGGLGFIIGKFCI
eukprot:CAMPEP_0202449990 /NCGR_PEP_ID=MMETSP1360-20130828/8651_1 /ASSEMBLY_ACC=CAM_ASM_000848 /TAXON_ID=515479 /ORGANISM="Licmophora paradoxa, Strain CCMP2313" /LENGTH=171 /DNA_ID=CAMNT_0049068093 /DNA_START=73 /DNA_END=588 /DNA_ORIENTATION=-